MTIDYGQIVSSPSVAGMRMGIHLAINERVKYAGMRAKKICLLLQTERDRKLQLQDIKRLSDLPNDSSNQHFMSLKIHFFSEVFLPKINQD